MTQARWIWKSLNAALRCWCCEMSLVVCAMHSLALLLAAVEVVASSVVPHSDLLFRFDVDVTVQKILMDEASC